VITLDAARFHNLWTRLTGSTDGADHAFRRLRRAHRQLWRSYHDTSHVVAVLAELDTVRDLLEDPDAAEIAVWFHDAVYVPWRPHNEEKSAELARRFLEPTGIDPKRLDCIVRHILATRHQVEPSDPDSRFVVDADLAILGASQERYDEYERQVRREYIWVPRSEFQTGRIAILRQFLDRPMIYSTAAFRGRLETAAWRNLSRALSRLSA
jgi:predicted metal-dependent HD superfamily phosphohydrolase